MIDSKMPTMNELLQKKGGSPDQQFEQGFFQLAYDKLQSKLFNLLPHMVGFEVVNKATDGTKAVGVFGFKSNNGQILYVPAFFINGKVKELDVMYSRNNNQFYPLNEDFAQMFLKDDATGLGSVSEQSRKDIEKQTPQVDMRDMVFPPRTGRVAYASVIDFIEAGDDNIKAAAWSLLNEHPEFTEGMYRFYSPEELSHALQPQEKVAKVKALRVVYPKNAPAEVKAKAMENGFAAIDNRSEGQKSRYGLITYPDKFSNPTEPGFYSYLTVAGTVNYGLVLQPQSLFNNFRSTQTLVLNLQAETKGQCHVLIDGAQVFVREAFKIEDFKEVHKVMGNPVEGEASFSRTYILLNETLKSTEPFRILMNYVDDRKLRRLRVEVERYFGGFYNAPAKPFNREKEERGAVTLVFTKKEGNSLDYRGNTIYVPKGFKLLEVTSADDYPSCCLSESSGSAKKREKEDATRREAQLGRPGTIEDLNSYLRQSGMLPFTLRTNGSEYFAKVGGEVKKYDNALAAKVGMLLNFGLDEADATELVTVVSEQRPATGYFKYAVTGDFTHTLRDEPESANELGQPTTYGIPYEAVAPNDHFYQGDPTQRGLGVTQGPDQGGWGNSKQDASNASSLAANGQKEIFDTNAIAMISKYTDPTSKVLSYLPNFVDTLDKLGRMLFMVYWETDKFHKMYGVDELPELIELIKSVFRNLGDLVIFLKRKFPDISINSNEQDMSEGG